MLPLRSAQPSGWARIETLPWAPQARWSQSSAQPSGWARIETSLTAQQRQRQWPVAPSLRVGRGLKQNTPPKRQPCPSGSAQPSGWARIETKIPILSMKSPLGVAPSLRVGRGLKPLGRPSPPEPVPVAPSLRVGRGLKLRGPGWQPASAQTCSAQPSGWARIETLMKSSNRKKRLR